eukprot:996785-Prymnesium_polylepis.1
MHETLATWAVLPSRLPPVIRPSPATVHECCFSSSTLGGGRQSQMPVEASAQPHARKCCRPGMYMYLEWRHEEMHGPMYMCIGHA